MPLETDKSGGFKMSLDELIGSGVFPEVFSRRVPFWSVGENVEFTDFGVELIKGHTELADVRDALDPVDDSPQPPDPVTPVRGLVQTTESGLTAVFFGTLTDLYRYIDGAFPLYNFTNDAGPYNGIYARQPGELQEATHWSMVEYGDWIFATNGVDKPQVFKGDFATSFIDVVGMDILSARIFLVLGPHILAFNTDCCDREFVWCDADNPDDWIAADSNLAGQLEIRELETEIKCAVPLGSRVAVYGSDQMFLVNYLSNDLVFGYKPALNGIGAVSPKSVVPVGRRNFGLSPQGFFVTDGLSFEYIDEPAMRNHFKDNTDHYEIGGTVAYHHEETTQIRWYIPANTGPTDWIAYSYNYEKNVWSCTTSIYSACQERTTYPGPVVGKDDGRLYLEADGLALPDGSPIPYSMVTKGLDLQDADKVKEVTNIRIGMMGGGLNFSIGWAETEQGTVTYDPSDVYLLNSRGDGFIDLPVRTAGRWMFMKFEGAVADADWELVTLEIIGRLEGTR